MQRSSVTIGGIGFGETLQSRQFVESCMVRSCSSIYPDGLTDPLIFLAVGMSLEYSCLHGISSSGETVIDVGGNRGMLAIIASHLVGNQGRVICFEPNPKCLKILDQEIAANQISNILVHRFGLGDHEEELVLSVPTANSGEGTFGRPAYGADVTYQVLVQIKRGDELLVDERPSFIKIDVEGFECKAVNGLAKTIAQHHPIVVTILVVQRHLLACGSSIAELKGLMESLDYEGYRLSLRKEQGRYSWYLARFEEQEQYFDAVWLHSKSARHHAIRDDRVACP